MVSSVARRGETRPGSKKRVLLIEDHPVVRLGLRHMIDRTDDLRTCGEADAPEPAMAMAVDLAPDVVVLDISLKGRSGLDLIKELKRTVPSVPVLALSMHDEDLYAERALRAGAQGYIMKGESTDLVVHAIRRVLDGHVYLSDRMTDKLLQQLGSSRREDASSAIDRLTDRELEVLNLIGRGQGMREIAEGLGVGVRTIETYRERIKEKLGLKTAIDVVHYAVRWEQDQGGQ